MTSLSEGSVSKAFLATVFIGALGACQQQTDVLVDASAGRALFETQCAACHGRDAKGGGPASLGLGVAPPDLTHISKMNAGVFPKDEVMSVIDGYFRREHFNDPMPIFGEEDLGPLVQVEENGTSTPVPADLLALAAYLESIQVE